MFKGLSKIKLSYLEPSSKMSWPNTCQPRDSRMSERNRPRKAKSISGFKFLDIHVKVSLFNTCWSVEWSFRQTADLKRKRMRAGGSQDVHVVDVVSVALKKGKSARMT